MCRCADCPVREATLCNAVPRAEVAVLEALREDVRRVAAGDELVRQGRITDHFYILVSGWLCLYELMEDGRRQVLRFALPGDLVGFFAGREPSPLSAMAITPAAACAIPRARFQQLARERPDLALRLNAVLSAERSCAYELVTTLGRRTAHERVAFLLLELFRRVRGLLPTAECDRVRLPVTQALIADALGLTPVHTNRMLQQLRREGIVALEKGVLRVIDPHRLAAAAGVEPG